jgi:hypothetical protein
MGYSIHMADNSTARTCDTKDCDEQGEFIATYRGQAAQLCMDDAERVIPFADTITDLKGGEV